MADMGLYAIIVGSVFATSLLSGILGMAGGMILMALLVTTLSVANAMMLHGAVQATANGSRAWLLRRHIKWRLLPIYSAGAGLSVMMFALLVLVPEPGVVLILVGLFPWLGLISKRLRGLDVTRPLTTLVCGFAVTSAQLLAGASGPLLDVFYLNAPLNRQEIVANKALTQTLGHVLKILYYGWVVAVSTTLPTALFALAVIAAVAGTRVGTQLLLRWNDKDFQRVSRVVILTIAALCIAEGVRSLWLAAA